MLAYGAATVGWAALAAFVGVFAAAVAVKTKLGFTWIARRLKRAYTDWFADAVDTHLQPKLNAAASDIIVKAEATALTVKHDLEAHTREEGEIVRREVKDAIAPLVMQVASAEVERHQFEGETRAMH